MFSASLHTIFGSFENNLNSLFDQQSKSNFSLNFECPTWKSNLGSFLNRKKNMLAVLLDLWWQKMASILPCESFSAKKILTETIFFSGNYINLSRNLDELEISRFCTYWYQLSHQSRLYRTLIITTSFRIKLNQF